MKAAVIEKPGELRVREVPEFALGEYDALCEMQFGATCTGTDQHMIEGVLPFPIPYPTVMGHESVGRVVKVGAKVRSFRVGDLVSRVGHPGDTATKLAANWGGFCEWGLARDHLAMKFDGLPRKDYDGYRIHNVIPAGIDPREATMIITWRETWSYAKRMGVGAGSRVLVIGSGGNGLAFVSHARNRGAASVVAVGSASREAQGRAAGASVYVDYREKDLAAAIRQQHPEPFDFIIDGVGKSGQVNRVLGLLRDGGTVGVYGIDDFTTYGISPFCASGSFRVFNGGYDEEESHEEICRLILEKKLDASIWLDLSHPVPLERIDDAFALIRSRKAVKALVDLRPSR